MLKHAACSLGLALIALAVFYPMLHARELVFDDYSVVGKAPPNLSFRMLTHQTYRMDGDSKARLHATNIAVHALTAIAIYALVDAVVAKAAFWGALLFLVHPLFGVMGQYVAARSSGLAALFIISACAVVVRFKSRKKWFAVAVFAALAAISKEEAVFMVSILTAMFAFEDRRIRVAVITCCLSVGILAAYSTSADDGMFQKLWVHAENVGLIVQASYPQYVASIISGYGYHILPNIFLPNSITGDPKLEYGVLPVVFAIVVMAGLIALFLRTRNMALYISATFLLFAPPLARVFIKTHDSAFEYRAYLSGAGFALLAAYGLSRLTSVRVRTACALSLAVAFALYTSERSKVWLDGVSFWEDVVKSNPSTRALSNLAANYQRQENFRAAIDTYRLAIKANYRLPIAHTGLAATLLSVGDLDGARNELEIALQQDPKHHMAYANYAALHLQLGYPGLALAMADKAISIKKDSTVAHLNRAAALANLNKPTEARMAKDFAEQLRKGSF